VQRGREPEQQQPAAGVGGQEDGAPRQAIEDEAPDAQGGDLRQDAGAEQQAEQGGLLPLDGELPGEGDQEDAVAQQASGLSGPQQAERAAQDPGEAGVPPVGAAHWSACGAAAW